MRLLNQSKNSIAKKVSFKGFLTGILHPASCIFAIALCIASQTAFAKPERMHLKAQGKKTKEQAAQAVTKNIRVGDIEDPTARKAIQEILNYLEMPYKK